MGQRPSTWITEASSPLERQIVAMINVLHFIFQWGWCGGWSVYTGIFCGRVGHSSVVFFKVKVTLLCAIYNLGWYRLKCFQSFKLHLLPISFYFPLSWPARCSSVHCTTWGHHVPHWWTKLISKWISFEHQRWFLFSFQFNTNKQSPKYKKLFCIK